MSGHQRMVPLQPLNLTLLLLLLLLLTACVHAFVLTTTLRIHSRSSSSSSSSSNNRGAARCFPRTSIVVHDTRRKRKLHYDVPKPDSSDGSFDNWEYGINAGWHAEHAGRKPRQKNRGGRAGKVGDGDKDGEGEEEGEGNSDEFDDDSLVKDVAAATDCLAGFCTDARLERLREIVGKRTGSVRFVFENVANPNNLWACLRSLDAFGVQYAHVIVDAAHYRKPHRLAQAKSAVGSQKWLTVTEHTSASECVAALKAEGYLVVASDLSPDTSPTPIQEVEWAAQKVAVVMGNEERGITEEMRALCDGTFLIPMMGFAESFNLSVGTAVTLAFLSSLGGFKHGDLPQDEKDRLVLRWLLKSVPQGAAILKREGLLVEDELVMPASDTVLGFKLWGSRSGR